MKFHLIVCVVLIVVIAIGCLQLNGSLRNKAIKEHSQAAPPTPQKTKLSPLSNNESPQYHSKVAQSGLTEYECNRLSKWLPIDVTVRDIPQSSNRVTTSDLRKLSDRMVEDMCKLDSVFRCCNVIPQRCTVVVVIPKCTVVVKGDLKTSPQSKVVEKNIKKDIILEHGGRTDIFDLEVFE